jgi:uncharacterized protein (DUF2147 family)
MRQFWIIAFLLSLPAIGHTQQSGVLGQWKTPTGAIVSIYHCDASVCARLIVLDKQAPTRVDANNPNTALRTRSLCGLQIGKGFHLVDSNHAEAGELYDPKSGKTYNGLMEMDGDRLKLRGYIGIRLFGRTEMWDRVSGNMPACSP